MKITYVDSSCLVAISLGEPGSWDLLGRISRFDRLFSSNLLEAELKSALAREKTKGRFGNLLALMRWVLPRRPLTREINQVLTVGRLKGPDLWHLASALFLRRQIADLFFITLDTNQSDIARALGFRVL